MQKKLIWRCDASLGLDNDDFPCENLSAPLCESFFSDDCDGTSCMQKDAALLRFLLANKSK